MKMNMKTINALSATAILTSHGLPDRFERRYAPLHVFTNQIALEGDDTSSNERVASIRTYH